MGCNYLSLPLITASGTTLLISSMGTSIYMPVNKSGPSSVYVMAWCHSGNGLPPVQCHAISWTNANILYMVFGQKLKIKLHFSSRKCTWISGLWNVGILFSQVSVIFACELISNRSRQQLYYKQLMSWAFSLKNSYWISFLSYWCLSCIYLKKWHGSEWTHYFIDTCAHHQSDQARSWSNWLSLIYGLRIKDQLKIALQSKTLPLQLNNSVLYIGDWPSSM